MVAHPFEALDRVLDLAAGGHRRSEHQYRADPDWEPTLHALVGAPWPCPSVSEFAPVWSDTVERLSALQLGIGRSAYGGWDDADPALARAAWCLVRHLRPHSVVETGVARGISTRILLEALERNGQGRLWSIDLPPLTEWELHEEIGAAVPPDERARWTLLKGSSRHRLPPLLSDLGAIELFVHDSMHTGRNMSFEFEQAWSTLNHGGAILADDIHRNAAFRSFAESHPQAQALICPADDGEALFGVLRKPSPPMG